MYSLYESPNRATIISSSAETRVRYMNDTAAVYTTAINQFDDKNAKPTAERKNAVYMGWRTNR